MSTANGWWIYQGTGEHLDGDLAELLPEPPPWRRFTGGPLQPPPPNPDGEFTRRLGPPLRNPLRRPDPHEVEMVNAALYLRRPLLVTGLPGTGKSSLAYRIARELRLGRVLSWPITTRSTLANGLYDYDAIGRIQAAQAGSPSDTGIGNYLQLGPLGTALLPYRLPRVLLVDELDKSDIDLPNDLLSVLEDGEFRIKELARIARVEPDVTVFTDDPDATAVVRGGRVCCKAFPMIVITSNGERDFPAAFLRRCLRLDIAPPDIDQLACLVAAHFGTSDAESERLIRSFVERGTLPADQLLNALYLATSGARDDSWPRLVDSLWRELSTTMN